MSQPQVNAVSTELGRSVSNNDVDFEATLTDPRDFYRSYQTSHGDTSPKGFHQDALRTSGFDEEPLHSRRRKSSAASAQSQDARSLRSARSSTSARQLAIVTDSGVPPKTLTSRKASFRDLVARFDASPDDIPPVPPPPVSLSNSRKNSPVVYSNPHQNSFHSPRKLSHDLHNSHRNASESRAPKAQHPTQETLRQQRPLFGEVLSGGMVTGTAGYGITNARRRRGSEGSPMHSPNPMFPDSTKSSLPPRSIGLANTQHSAVGTDGASSDSAPHHRRANSDFSRVATSSRIPAATGVVTDNIDISKVQSNRMSGSKLPVSTRRQSLTSDSGPSNPSSRAASKLDNYQSPPPASKAARMVTSTTNAPKPTPRRKHQPPHIQSPGRQGRKVSNIQGEKSPSLRANIIAPPPKISPPLRGSRQRLPVSSATTAASRARMAEKFQIMAREQSDKRSGSRRTRPPELTDIDFDARRLKITQALSRSREGNDLRVNISATTSRKNSIAPSIPEGEPTGEAEFPSSDVPALVIQSPNVDNDEDVFKTPTEDVSHADNAFTQNALRVLETRQQPIDEGDSPTLGQGHELEPMSALTEDTDNTSHTPIEPEPQVDEPQQGVSNLSLLTHITSMREQDLDTPPSERSRGEEYSLDRTDAESVQLFLRNTTYNMDEEEAVAKGYRDFLPPPPLPKLPEAYDANRSSWTSSIADHSEGQDDDLELPGTSQTSEAQDDSCPFTDNETSSPAPADDFNSHDESIKNSAADHAYTIVNIVVQEQSTSGVVDQQLVDDIYRQILSEEPQIEQNNSLDEHRVVELCVRGLEDYNEREDAGEDDKELTQAPQESTPTDDIPCSDDNDTEEPCAESATEDDQPPPAPPKDLFPPPTFRTHKYKSSLDSAEDWLDASPSVGDWMQFGLNRGSDSEKPKESSPLSQEQVVEQVNDTSAADQAKGIEQEFSSTQDTRASLVVEPPPRPPSHSPPPPPVHDLPSIEQMSRAASSSTQTTFVDPPQIPHRVASLSQMSSRQPTSLNAAVGKPEAETQSENSNQRRLRQRRHVLKEIVDTEFSYERDLRVLCDIYQQTAMACLSEDDVKVMFGNVDGVQLFAKDFLADLKQAAKPAYIMERQDRKRELTRTDTSTSDQISIRTEAVDLSDSEKDRQTRIGQAFDNAMADMEAVYKDYIRGRHAANQKLTQLQTSAAVKEWLKECSDNSSDITNAWSLDALLVKPIQRITKYPLLLTQLLESTPADHPDHKQLRDALSKVTDINIKINEVKKHTETIDQVMSRKRKESDVRTGLTKAFGRRAEKLRQHVGINDVYEDGEYSRLKMDYDNNGVHLLIVSKDCQGYIDSIRAWVVRMCEMAAAAEAWLDVGHTNHAEAESKLRQLAMAARGISTIALPDHTELVMRKVIQPMEKALVMLERFKTEPKGLLQKREKKILDYNQLKNKRDRGEKLDRRMTEKLEQWEAINTEVKQRMRQLKDSTAALVQSCLGNLVHLHMAWVAVVEQKLAAAMAIPLEGLQHVDLVREWQVDFDFQHASAMSLGICNGSLLAEAMNLMSFLTPGSTLNGDESPRQSSWNTKRSISMNSEVDSGPRYSNGPHSSHGDYPPESSSFGQNSSRNRATSLASGRTPHTPDMSGRSTGLSVHMPNGGQYPRPGTSPGRSDDSTQPPRVSLDAPSPSLGAFRASSPARPGSASTFFSAAPGPSNHTSQPGSGGSVFSSAMPLTDSPETERTPGLETPNNEPDALFTAASVYEFNIDRARQEGGIPYLTYTAGEIFDVIGERGELWLARNQDDLTSTVGWIWNKHFAKLAA